MTAAQDGAPKVIPTVGELPLVGSLCALQSDALAFVRRIVHECGDMGRFHLGPVEGFVLNAPAAIRGVLVDDAGAFDKGGPMLNAYHTIGQTLVLIREGEAQRVRFSLAPGQRVVPEAGPVLRQAEGCKVIIHHRT